MSASASPPSAAVTVGRKTYGIAPKDLAGIKAAVAKGWAPLIRGLRAQLAHTQELWTLHQNLREASFLTAEVVDAVARTGFPPQDVIKAADASVTRLQQVVDRGDFAAIQDAYDQAGTLVRRAVAAVQHYHEAISEGGEDCVKTLRAIQEASKLMLDLMAGFATFGKPQLKAPMAAALGSYEELLTQIEAAQTSRNFDVRRSATIVLAAGARKALLEQLMGDGRVGKILVEKTGAGFARSLGRYCGNAGAVRILQKMFKSALEDGVKTALGDLMEQCTDGKRMTFEKAVHHAFEEAAKKAGLAAILGGFDKQLEAINDTVLRKIGNGTIKGLKVDNPKAVRELKALVEETAGKLAGKFLEQDAGHPAKFAAMNEAVAKQVLDDAAFKAAAAKLAGQKAR